ncbi:peptidase M16 [Leptolyngbya sp. 'hensonii']|uniref:M16 family metallopeptidase n=1 Tax=Leptolyngbya sp. 'hensonii' TaxID=1922337 RepID=UPI00094F6F23|nr:pitrilysin family protein [Leptolyngbya sp. 'hensonii']OLP15676.1 peptidase M16 [Leptolyngbya sp. 'hensonii']
MLNRSHRFHLPFLLFAIGLSAVLFFSPVAGFSQTTGLETPQALQPPEIVVRQSNDQQPGSLSLTQGVKKTVLENGLTVLTKEVHTAPVVTVQVWYRVGSRDETPGINGIAHQLEHLLFKGTQSRPIQFGRLFSALGSSSNAFTSYDQTAYFGTVRRDKLDALLVLEADRMQNSIIDADQLTSEKRVVISELQGYENSPDYRLRRTVLRTAFPDSSYGLPIGGTKADVEQFTVEQVRAYYRTYYHPDNAVLVIVGDFQTEPTLKRVRESFGQIAGRSPGERKDLASTQATVPAQTKPTTPIVLRERGSAPLIQMVYPLPTVAHPDIPALQVMDLVLTEGRSSRLYQALIETGLTSATGGYTANLIAGGWYTLYATAVSGQSLEKIDQVFLQTISTLQEKGITEAELNRAKAQLLASTILQNRDITSQAFQLGNDQISTGDYRYTDKILAAVKQVTSADVQRVAKTYLQPIQRTVGYFEPLQQAGNPGVGSSGAVPITENFSPGQPVDPAEVAKYLPPANADAVKSTQALPQSFTLPNGLKVLLLPDRSTPTVTLSGYIRAGAEFDTPESAGLASLTAGNLMNGTRTKDALTLAQTLENQGARLGFSANREGVSVGGIALDGDLPILISTLADVVQNASFPAQELELSRQRALTGLKLELDNPARLGRRVFQQTVYPNNHPFHTFPTEASLKGITRDGMVRFYQEHYRPDATVLALVGSFDPATVKQLLQRELGLWKTAGAPPAVTYPSVSLPKSPVRLTPDMPGKTQSVTLLGYQGINRRDPLYYPSLVLNEILGGSTLSSRLGTEIRDRQGLTYGIYSFFAAGQQKGPFLIQMQTAPEDAQRAIVATVKLLEQLRDVGVTPDEVTTAKRALTNSYPVDLADPDNLTEVILMNQVYGLSLDELRQFPAKVDAITPVQVNQAIKELIHPDRLVIVTAGPVSAASK